jgi:hypothetical protein
MSGPEDYPFTEKLATVTRLKLQVIREGFSWCKERPPFRSPDRTWSCLKFGLKRVDESSRLKTELRTRRYLFSETNAIRN